MARILLADDNDGIREMLVSRLAQRGHEVLEAVDGAQAIALATSQSPDVILMDLSMPVVDGWQASAN